MGTRDGKFVNPKFATTQCEVAPICLSNKSHQLCELFFLHIHVSTMKFVIDVCIHIMPIFLLFFSFPFLEELTEINESITNFAFHSRCLFWTIQILIGRQLLLDSPWVNMCLRAICNTDSTKSSKTNRLQPL